MKINNLREGINLGVISKEFKSKVKIVLDLQLKVPL
jgi:dihydroneopterin aldolase